MAVNWIWRARQLQRFAAQDPPHEYANCITKAHLRRAKLLAPDPTEMDPDEPMWPENWGLLPQSLPSFLTRGEWVSLPEYPADGEGGEEEEEEEEVPTPREVSKDPKASKDPDESGKKAATTIATKPTANSTMKPKTQSTTQPPMRPPTKPPTKPPMKPKTRPTTRPTTQLSPEQSGSNKPQAKCNDPGTSARPQVQAEGQVQVQGHRQTIAQEPQYPLLPSLLPSILPYSPLLSPSPAAPVPPPPPPPTSATPSTSLPLGIRVSGAWPEGEEGGEANFDAASSSRDREQPKYLVIEEEQEQPPPGTRGFTWDEMKECLEYLKHERRKR